jgi:hypothetical protein
MSEEKKQKCEIHQIFYIVDGGKCRKCARPKCETCQFELTTSGKCQKCADKDKPKCEKCKNTLRDDKCSTCINYYTKMWLKDATECVFKPTITADGKITTFQYTLIKCIEELPKMVFLTSKTRMAIYEQLELYIEQFETCDTSMFHAFISDELLDNHYSSY